MPRLILQPVALALVLSLPVALKWRIELPKAALGAVLAGLGAAVATAPLASGNPWLLLAAQAAVTICLLSAGLVFFFHRDPERVPPGEGGLIVAPADGRVLYVKELPGGGVPTSYKQGFPFRLEELAGSELLSGSGWLVGIGMNFLDVHVNRSPIRGRVVLSRLTKGAALSLKRPEALHTNTRLTTVIEGEGLSAAVVQITSRLVRHISSYIRSGDTVEMGQRIGMIRFGSQVDLLLPGLPGLLIECRPQQRVKAGESVIARLRG
jgi:phosphatidylserine decarboxylase